MIWPKALGDIEKRCFPHLSARPERHGYSPRPGNACGLCGVCLSSPCQRRLSIVRMSNHLHSLTASTNQKSSVIQTLIYAMYQRSGLSPKQTSLVPLSKVGITGAVGCSRSDVFLQRRPLERDLMDISTDTICQQVSDRETPNSD